MTPASTPATIMVADDEPSIRTLLEVILSADGHHVVTVADGREALLYLKDNTPDLAILDLSMPVLDGLDVCERMKRTRRLVATPVLILTAYSDDRTRDRVKLARADAMMNKPISGKNFRQTVRDLIGKGVAARAAEAAPI